MADDAQPLHGAHDPDRDVVARLIDEARPRPAILPPTREEVDTALRRVLARRDRHDSLDIAVIPIDRYRGRTRRRVLAAAAAVFVLLGAGLVWKSAARRTDSPAQTSALPRELESPRGEVASFTLPDGTHLVLGPRSLLTVGAEYGVANRIVSLRGDAYFDVVHDAARPFTVRTPSAELVDAGTAFSVRDAGALGTQVSVATGRVAARASAGSNGDTATLGPSDRAIVQRDGRIRVDVGASTTDDHAWIQGRLVFRDAPIEYVAAQLRRWYGIELRIGDPTFRSRRLTATFDRASASDVGPVIAAALGGTARQAGDTLYVTPIAGGARRR